MSSLSPEKLVSPDWHGVRAAKSKPKLHRLSVWEFLVPAVVVSLLLVYGAHRMAIVVAVVALAVIGIRNFSSGGRRNVDMIFAKLALWVGSVVATILLAPIFYVIMPAIRLFSRLTGSDPLHLRVKEDSSFWLPSDLESRRHRHVSRMFCTERQYPRRMALIPVLVLGIALLAATEIGLRIYGFRDAILYVQDYEAGYYPLPNQRVRNPGRIIEINGYGMRSPDFPKKKQPGKFRILMLGDSTLAGTKVSNHELYSSLLQAKLNQAAGSDVFEVMNMGVNAWGPHHELGFVKKFGSFDADLAIICGPVLNCYRPLYTLDSLPFMPATHPPRLALEHVAYQLLWQYRGGCVGPAPYTQGEYAVIQGEKGIQAYGEMAEFLQSQGAEVIAEMLPTRTLTLGLGEEPHAEELIQRIGERFAKIGAKAHLAGPIFKGVANPKALYHDKIHFDKLGHRLYADYLYGQVLKNSVKVSNRLAH